jgi:hypothetical protein
MSQERANGEAPARRAPDPALPLFFRRVAALDLQLHAGLKLDRAKGGYRYAAATNALPLAGSEFAAAAAHYPIVFAGSGPATAVAATGTRDGQNLFVDGAGLWRPGKYIPAYARAYPFILLEIPGGGCWRPTRCRVPRRRHRLGAVRGRQGLAGARRWHCSSAARCTRISSRRGAFCVALDAAGLLVANQATIALRSGASLRLEGFKVIDLAKFDAVDDAQFLEWRRRGWLTLIYAHFLSTARRAGIVDLTAAAEPAQAR